MRSARNLRLVALTASMFGIGAAHAQTTDTATLNVTATVESACSLSGSTLDFGTYLSGQSTPNDVTGQISFVNCSGTLTFELDGGQSGNVSARAMTSGSGSLNYQLYRDSSRSDVFGTGSEAQQTMLLVPQSGTIDVHGRIAAGQVVPAGAYSDTVNITLSF